MWLYHIICSISLDLFWHGLDAHEAPFCRKLALTCLDHFRGILRLQRWAFFNYGCGFGDVYIKLWKSEGTARFIPGVQNTLARYWEGTVIISSSIHIEKLVYIHHFRKSNPNRFSQFCSYGSLACSEYGWWNHFGESGIPWECRRLCGLRKSPGFFL